MGHIPRIHVYMDADLLEAVDHIAHEAGDSRSAVIAALMTRGMADMLEVSP